MEINFRIEIEDFLKKCLTEKLQEIYLTGFSEIENKFQIFYPMLWNYYLKFEDYFICIASDSIQGALQFYVHQQIQCNFEIEEDNIFTISPLVRNRDFYGEIISFDLFYSSFDQQLWAIGLNIKQAYFVENNGKKVRGTNYVFFDSLNFDGIIVGDERGKKNYLEDDRFYIKSFPHQNENYKSEK